MVVGLPSLLGLTKIFYFLKKINFFLILLFNIELFDM
jgi:hypothetical protein